MPTGKPYSKDFKLDAVEKALINKINHKITYSKTAEDLGIHHTILCRWIKEFRPKTEPEIAAEIFTELEEKKESEPGRLSIQNHEYREDVIVALVMSGYRVWQEVENGDFLIYYE